MSTSKRVLGRGLGALLKGTSDAGYENQVQHIDISRIIPNPFQPRRSFTTESIQELAESIQKNDLIQPIVLRLNSSTDHMKSSQEKAFSSFYFFAKRPYTSYCSKF